MSSEIANQRGTEDTNDMGPPSYPRTRSQTRSLPHLKRKSSDTAKSPTTRPAKIARAAPIASATPSQDFSPEAVVDPTDSLSVVATGRTMWPPDVPRSMLFTFRAGHASQTHDGAHGTSTLDATRSPDTPQYPAEGPEPMFDHSWRISFIESVHTQRLVPLPTPVDANPHRPHSSGSLHVSAYVAKPSNHAPVSPLKSTSTVGALPPHGSRRGGKVADENISPYARHVELSRIEGPKQTPIRLPAGTEFLVPLSSSGSWAHNRCGDTQPCVGPQSRLSTPFVAPGDGFPQITPGGYHNRQPHVLRPSPSASSLTWVPPGFDTNGHPPFLPPYPVSSLGHTSHFNPSIPLLGITQHPPPSSHLMSAPASRVFPVHPSHHMQHLPTFSLPPHPGAFPIHGRPSYPPPGHPPVYLPPPPYTQINPGSSGTSDGLGRHASVHAPHSPHLPLSYMNPSGLSLPALPPLPPKLPLWKRTTTNGAPWSMFYESIQHGKEVEHGRGMSGAYTPARTGINRQVQHNHLQESVRSANTRARNLGETYKCPFCARVFSLPNGLAVHRKWHWGASGILRTKGIRSRNGRTVERAFRDAQHRREEAAKRQEEQDFPGIPISISVAYSPTLLSSSPRSSKKSSRVRTGGYITVPTTPQSSSDTFTSFYPPHSFAGASGVQSVSHAEFQGPHVFPQSIIPVPGSITRPSLPHTPELLTDSGSVNSASTGHGSPTWSENLFGCDEDADDIDAEGEIDDEDDMFGSRFDVPGHVTKPHPAAGAHDASIAYSSSAVRGPVH
ncbi:hypothetical protein C2E23DRAFT_621092 [Lenzites betulinus]|nr:hypothetical protein C2E23DRAFT_621092 [Lenzites betulinus]